MEGMKKEGAIITNLWWLISQDVNCHNGKKTFDKIQASSNPRIQRGENLTHELIRENSNSS